MKPIPSLLEGKFARRLGGAFALTFTLALAAPLARAQLYSQNFDSSTSGAVPTGWLVANLGGTWQVSTGTDKTYDSIDQTAGPEITYYNSASWDTGYTYSADVRLWGTGYGNQVGVVYYFKDTSNYYEVQLGGANDPTHGNTNFHLYEHVAGAVTEVDANFTSPGSGNFVTLTVVRSGTSTTLKVNGTTILTRTQTALTGGGKIGLVDRYASVKGNNITVVDSAPPTVAITAPANNANVSGSSVAVTASASDNIGVTSVQFTLDGGNLQAADTSSPYAITWDSTLASPGVHTLGAIAHDAAGNSTPTSISVNVTNGLPAGWTNGDVGSPGAPGSTTYSSSTGSYIVEGAGANIWGTSDEFQFAHESVTGDCTVIARVVTVDNTATWSKAGIMLREDTSAGSKYVLLAMTPARGLLFEARTDNVSPNNVSIQPAVQGTIRLPMWLKLVRSGDNFSASYSTDGTIWSSAGMVVSGTSNRQSTVNVRMNAAVSVGLAVCSTVHGTPCTATFDHVSAAAADIAHYNPGFPRLGNYAIGGHYSDGQAYFSEARTMLSKFHVAIIAGSGEDWSPGRSEGGVAYGREDVVSGIHNQSAIGTKVLQYVILESIRTNATPQLPTWRDRVVTNNWWLYDSGTSGSMPEAPFGLNTSDFYAEVNPTQFVPNDSVTGMRPFAAGASIVHDIFVNTGGSYGGTGMAAPSLDGLYLDNVFPYTRVTGDWDRSASSGDPDDVGYNDSTNTWNATAAGWWQAAQADYFNQIRTLMGSTKLQTGNNAEFGNVGRPSNYSSLTPLGSLNQLLQGGLLEPAIGSNSAPESWGGPNYTSNLIGYYKYSIDALASPKLLVWEHRLSLTGTDNLDTTSYRAMRYGLACCLMNDAYYDPNNQGDLLHTNANTRWFDEFSVYNGVGQSLTSANVTKGLGYLGRPVANSFGAVQTSPRFTASTQHGTFGVWAREFEGGIVLMSPRGNGPATITVGSSGTDLNSADWKRISGTQNSTVNSGADVTGNISLADRDAIILLRK